MFYFIKKNAYVKDGVSKCFVSLYDPKSDDIISCGPVNSLSGADLAHMTKDCVFGTPVEVDLAFSTFNGSVRPQICNLHKLEVDVKK